MPCLCSVEKPFNPTSSFVKILDGACLCFVVQDLQNGLLLLIFRDQFVCATSTALSLGLQSTSPFPLACRPIRALEFVGFKLPQPFNHYNNGASTVVGVSKMQCHLKCNSQCLHLAGSTRMHANLLQRQPFAGNKPRKIQVLLKPQR